MGGAGGVGSVALGCSGGRSMVSKDGVRAAQAEQATKTSNAVTREGIGAEIGELEASYKPRSENARAVHPTASPHRQRIRPRGDD